MGGRAQTNWLHAVPKVRDGRADRPHLRAWRWTSKTGMPEQQPGYNAPRHFSQNRASGAERAIPQLVRR